MDREKFTKCRSYCVRATSDAFVERYLLADFTTAYNACMFSKRVEKLAKGGYIDYIARIACEFERELRRRALKGSRNRKPASRYGVPLHPVDAAEADQIRRWAASQPSEGAGRG